jgi:hypothetical protein
MSVSSTAKGACHCQEGGNVRVRSDQFRQYAEEALLWAAQSKTEEEKRLLFELVLTWTQAAFASDRIVVVSGSTAEPRAP